MGRAPCCEKMGLKKGPWTPEEDRILTNYIRVHGHTNWRALPKLAGLLRCGKSCRLRWTNYLRPDIKRGNFSTEEEEAIIKLHEMLGNRWSAIAAKLPGRTDNEIKNVWHTHLKKRLRVPNKNSDQNKSESESNLMSIKPCVAKKRARKSKVAKKGEGPKKSEGDDEHVNCTESKLTKNDKNSIKNNEDDIERPGSSVKDEPVSPRACVSTSEMSTMTSTSSTCVRENDNGGKEIVGGYFGDFTDINDDFWMEVLSLEDTAISTQDRLLNVSRYDPNHSSDHSMIPESVVKFEASSGGDEMEMDCFWYNLLKRTSNDLPEFSEIAL